MIEPGVADLLDAAIREGADLVGGLDPAGIDNDVKGQLDAIFGVAEKHGVGLDIHLHDFGPLGCSELREISARTRGRRTYRQGRGQPRLRARHASTTRSSAGRPTRWRERASPS